MQIKRRQFRLPLGFAVPLILMIVLVSIGLNNMADIQSRLKQIVEAHNVKTALVTTMRFYARERTISLYRMATLTDPFDKDDEFMKFNHSAFEYSVTRDKLVKMSLNENEKKVLDKQKELTIATVEFQNQVVDYAMADNNDMANRILYLQAVPGQEAVFSQLTKLMDIQANLSSDAVEISTIEYENAQALMISLSIAAILLGSIVALIVVKRTNTAEENLFLEKEMAQVTLRSIGEGVITVDNSGCISYLNPTAETLTGWDNANAIGLPLLKVFNLIDDNNEKILINPVSIAIKKQQVINSTSHTMVKKQDDVRYPIEHTASPILDNTGAVTGAVLVFRNLTAIRNMAKKMSHQATHDALTNLVNRQEFENQLKLALQNARENESRHVLCYFDLDQFKIVNDTCGHLAGDELLKQLVATLSAHVRLPDTFSRLGGDEFALLMVDCDISAAEIMANKLLTLINDYRFVWEGKSFVIGASFGLVVIAPNAGTITDLLSAADSACYAAKDAGRNRIHIYCAHDSILMRRRGEMQWLNLIREALENDGFILYCQKILDLHDTSEQSLHYEILIRMVRADGTHIPPMAFIPAAERYHLMPDIDRWVIRSAFVFLQQYFTSGENNKQLWTINLSGQSLSDEEFLSYIIDQFKTSGMAPSKICFEITETAAVKNLSRAIEFMTTLRTMGCQFALDDFGSGLSSFTYLKKLPVNYLKIDGSFVKDMLVDPIDRAMVESINQIGHIMQLKTVAEYVESEAAVEKLREMNIDFAQGFGVHYPQPIQELQDIQSTWWRKQG